MPQTSILSVRSSAGGEATLRNLLVGARSSVYRREIVQALKTSGDYRGFLMLAAIVIRPLGMHGEVLLCVSGRCR
jgi:hypothetical protein